MNEVPIRNLAYVETPFGNIHYRTSSAPEYATTPIVAIHGWLDNAATFEKLRTYSNWDENFIALDLPGHGASDWLTDYAFLQWLPVLQSFLDAMQIQNCHLVGHSLGGSIALMYAAFDSRISSVVAIDAIGPWAQTGEDWVDDFWASSSQRLKKRPEARTRSLKTLCEARKFALGYLNDEMAEILVKGGAEEVEGGWKFTHDPRLKNKALMRCTENHVHAAFRKISCPVLTIRAEGGYPVPEGLIEKRLEQISNNTYKSLPGHHHLHLSHAIEVGRLIEAFWNDNGIEI